MSISKKPRGFTLTTTNNKAIPLDEIITIAYRVLRGPQARYVQEYTMFKGWLDQYVSNADDLPFKTWCEIKTVVYLSGERV
tara:strand:- start:21946 stop:22188 length:243 start_codon:yes stop_codon:yes gene_type:complete